MTSEPPGKRRSAPSDSEGVERRFGPYQVYERLGIGGMAMVHRAKKLGPAGFERNVALKRMLEHLAEDPSFVESFIREAKVASMLVHPNIAQVYDFGRIGGVYYIAMELVAGFDVRKLLRFASKQNQAIPLQVILSLVGELCDALEHAHSFVDDNGESMHIVHRDISPSNMIVAHTGHVKVIDFGIAKANSRALHTDSGKIKGKLGYMSPEGVRGGAIGPESDVFSAAVVAWELITATPLFSQRTDFETMRRIREGEIYAPSQHNPACPQELDDIILASLQRDPARRPSAGAIHAAIGEIGSRVGVQVSHKTVAEWILQFAQPDEAWARASATSAARARTGSAPPPFVDQATSNLRGRLQRSEEAAQLATEIWGDKIVPTVGNLPSTPGRVENMRFSTPLPTQMPPPDPTRQLTPMPQPTPRSASRAPWLVLGMLAIVAGVLGAYLVYGPSSRESAAQPVATATLRFEVEPSGSVIEIGGKPVSDRSPFEVDLTPGVYALGVSRDGFKPWSGSITVRDAEPQTVQVSLQRGTAKIAIDSNPRGLVVLLDGKPTGHATPATFDATTGEHIIIVTNTAGEEWIETFTATLDGVHSFRATFKPAAVAQNATPTTKPPPTTPRKPPRASVRTPDPEPEPEADPPPSVDPPVTKPPVTKPPVKPDPPVTPKPPARTPVVAATAVTKISGDLPAMKVKSDNTNGDVLAKLCIDESGRVTSAKVVRSMPELVADLQRALATWRYKAFVRDGKPTPVCFALSLRVVVKRAN